MRFRTVARVPIIFVMSSFLPACPHVSTGLPLDGVSWNLILETSLKTCRENPSSFKIGQICWVLYMTALVPFLLTATYLVQQQLKKRTHCYLFMATMVTGTNEKCFALRTFASCFVLSVTLYLGTLHPQKLSCAIDFVFRKGIRRLKFVVHSSRSVLVLCNMYCALSKIRPCRGSGG
jgi:hypothetical protein